MTEGEIQGEVPITRAEVAKIGSNKGDIEGMMKDDIQEIDNLITEAIITITTRIKGISANSNHEITKKSSSKNGPDRSQKKRDKDLARRIIPRKIIITRHISKELI